ncbi:MAG: hypothetical protein GF344_09145 [Chitinivibrionales bacterium]|nr:hypothetical protein [Chitinivibrionales bacterium]MBD3357015.1 hypothetical protein [Chitinivibrionales bacterium]
MSIGITDKERDAIKEMANIGAGKAAGYLNQMFESHVALSIPDVEFIENDGRHDVSAMLGITEEPCSSVTMGFTGDFTGKTVLAFKQDDARRLADTLVNGLSSKEELDALTKSAFSEMGNIVINSVVGSISNILGTRVDFSIPSYTTGNLRDTVGDCPPGCESVPLTVIVHTHFCVQKVQAQGYLFLLVETGRFAERLATLAIPND